MDEYEQFEAECEKRREENHTFIIGFTRYLQNKKNISKQTVDKHVANIDFYINECLLYENPEKAADGVNQVNYFLGYWFIRKAMWASPTSIKENITSLKYFYTYMNKIGQVSNEELSDLKDEIKENKAEWIETVQKYDDPDVDIEDVWS